MLKESIIYLVMPNGHFLTYPILARGRSTGSTKRLINWVWYRNVAKGQELNDLLTDREGVLRDTSLAYNALQDRHLGILRVDAKDFLPPAFAELVMKAEPFIQAIFDGAIPSMAFSRVCIMGDAAFAARPHCAAGTAKAAEDAWQLGAAPAEADNDVVTAVKIWQERQLECGRRLVARAREIANRLQLTHSWPVGESFPFGLHESGDSAFPS
jgi:2,6-dihydroxypyridine 3-monooxygenase